MSAHFTPGRYDSSEERPEWTRSQLSAIDHRTAELLDERLYNDEIAFADLMDSQGSEAADTNLQRALRFLRSAKAGDAGARDVVMVALTEIDEALRPVAERIWSEELRDLAMDQYTEGALS